jgi:hypothetical protein
MKITTCNYFRRKGIYYLLNTNKKTTHSEMASVIFYFFRHKNLQIVKIQLILKIK